jgi:hypothetical protein
MAVEAAAVADISLAAQPEAVAVHRFAECRPAVLAVAHHSVRCRCEVSAVIE